MIGLYSNNLERFLIIKDDRWMSLQTGKILSSKFLLSLFEFDNNSNIDNSNCRTWSIRDTSTAMLDKPIPRIKHIEDQLYDTLTMSPDISSSVFLEYQEYCNFVYNVVLSSRLTDANLNSSDQKYILSLVSDNISVSTLSDDTGLAKPFLWHIDHILYFSSTKEEALKKISNLFDENLDIISLLNLYKQTFYDYLKKYETNI
jgi:hemolysin activation/secretion protein